jgi:hypothetical protein
MCYWSVSVSSAAMVAAVAGVLVCVLVDEDMLNLKS